MDGNKVGQLAENLFRLASVRAPPPPIVGLREKLLGILVTLGNWVSCNIELSLFFGTQIPTDGRTP